MGFHGSSMILLSRFLPFLSSFHLLSSALRKSEVLNGKASPCSVVIMKSPFSCLLLDRDAAGVCPGEYAKDSDRGGPVRVLGVETDTFLRWLRALCWAPSEAVEDG